MHFWVGSFCGILDGGSNKPVFPRKAIAATDIIALVEDLGNQIPDKSWMLYLLELFNKQQNIAIELNLICQFDSQNYFEAIFNGVNRYRFKEVLPILGHSYLRQIIMNSQKECISYLLQDRNTKQIERFDLRLNIGRELSFAFEASNQFTGIEWWNKIGNFPYQIRYDVQISQLMYGLSDNSNNPSDSEYIVYLPYNTLMPNSEGSSLRYPISFHNPRIESGCICYNVKPGICESGMKYISFAKNNNNNN
ncbi:MAG TPA: hypothetical protein VJ799_05095 [Nitrososphaeraceae archaeon]|nr:hypothetical protein [Nitrososphaeraceae archaeon]